MHFISQTMTIHNQSDETVEHDHKKQNNVVQYVCFFFQSDVAVVLVFKLPLYES